MRSLRFGDFRDRDYAETSGDEAEQLYVLRDETETLYVGISRRGIWRRWFDPDWGHLRRSRMLRSMVGRFVNRMRPASDEWTIELWTARDCWKYLGGKGRFMRKHENIERYEADMIRKLLPRFNTVHNTRTDEEPEDEASMAAREAFYEELGE